MTDKLRRYRYRASKTRLFAPITWLRHRGLGPEDVFLASYPRSGQNWTRFLLFELLTGKRADFDTLEEVIPKVGSHFQAPALLPRGGRLIQTHQPWRADYKRTIYLVRDLRDVILSDYAWDNSLHLTQYFDIHNFDEYLEPWLKGVVQTMGNWQDHVESWFNSPAARNGDVLVIKYEDMRKDTANALELILSFLGVSVHSPEIGAAIKNNSVEQMRAKEDTSRRYAPQALGRKSGEEHRFVRKGSVGGWRGQITEAQLRIIHQYTGRTLSALGYETGHSLSCSKFADHCEAR